jgi:ubiquinone biosynthesis protein
MWERGEKRTAWRYALTALAGAAAGAAILLALGG